MKRMAGGFCATLLVILLVGCAATIEYESSVGMREAIRPRARLTVEVDVENLIGFRSNAKTVAGIRESIQNDLRDNLLSLTGLGEADIVVSVKINKLRYSDKPWGLLWFPFAYIGAPTDALQGFADIVLSINDSSTGTEIGRYHAYCESPVRWIGLYYGYRYWLGRDDGIVKQVLREAMEEIKRKVIDDSDEINAMFEESEEPTIAEDKLPSGHLKYLDYEPLSLTSEAFLNRKQSLLIVETQLPSLLIESTRPPFSITPVDFGVYHAKLEPGPQVVTIKAMGYLPLDLPAHPSYDAGAIRKIRVFPKE